MEHSKINIKEIKLGADSAEKDIEIGLLRYFYQNEAYKKIINGEKTVLVGNRGVGKSAIFKYIAAEERRKGSIVLELSPEEYSYEILSKFLKQESKENWAKQSSYSVAWQFLIYNMVFKEIVTNKKGGFHTGAMEKIYSYVRDNISIKDVNPIGVLISYLKRLEGIKIGTFEAGLKVKELQKLYGLEEIKDLEPHFIRILEKVKIIVLIDELDKGWDNSEDAKYFIAGLFQAAQKLNAVNKKFRILISIRQELFENIPQIYDDAQKIRGDIEVIRWDADGLMEFIGLRIKDAVPQLGKNSNEERWGMLFDDTLEYRQVKSFNYLIDRTQLRPREFLQFCKACLVSVSKDGSKVDYEAISKAEINYSEQKIKDLSSEYRFQYPHLLDIFETFRGMKYTFEKEELDEHLIKLALNEISIGKAEWAKGLDYEEIKKILWQIGFIKALVAGGLKSGRKSGSSYLGIYELPSVNLENITRFQVHPAFRAYLNLKEKK